MKHIITNGWDFKKIRTGDKYYRLWFNMGLVWIVLFVPLFILGLCIPDIEPCLFQVLIITTFVLILATLIIFIVRVVKTKVVDWSHIIFSAAILWIVFDIICNRGGLNAVFSAT